MAGIADIDIPFLGEFKGEDLSGACRPAKRLKKKKKSKNL